MNNIHLHIIGSETFSGLLDELDINYSISTGNNLNYNNKDQLVKIIFVDKLQLIDIKKYFFEDEFYWREESKNNNPCGHPTLEEHILLAERLSKIPGSYKFKRQLPNF